MNGQDQSNTGETRWFGTDGRELTAKEYLRLLAKTQQTGTGAAEPEEQPPSRGLPVIVRLAQVSHENVIEVPGSDLAHFLAVTTYFRPSSI